jgi:hypothetical protein
VVTIDVGNHAYSLGRYLESQSQPVVMSGYLGSIGFATWPRWAPGRWHPTVQSSPSPGTAASASTPPSSPPR